MKKFKAGDKVVMKGVVETINSSENYNVVVRWADYKNIKFYLSNGKRNHLDTTPILFHDTPQERIVQVRNIQTEIWVNRVLIKELNGKYICWSVAETIEDAKKETLITSWNFMRELTEKRKLTMQEIADKFELDVDQIEIT